MIRQTINRLTIMLLLAFTATFPANAQMYGSVDLCHALDTLDATLARKDLKKAGILLQFGPGDQKDTACLNKLTGMLYRYVYLKKKYKELGEAWKKDSTIARQLRRSRLEELPQYEAEALLFAGLACTRTEDWTHAGELVLPGLAMHSADALIRVLPEKEDAWYLCAALAEAADVRATNLSGLLFRKFAEVNGSPVIPAEKKKLAFHTGQAAYYAQQWATALPLLEMADPALLSTADRHEQYFERGKCYDELGQFSKALPLLAELYEVDPSDRVAFELDRAKKGAGR